MICSSIRLSSIVPAIVQGYPSTLNLVIFLMPLLFCSSDSQLFFTLLPNGVIAPSPVTTTLLNIKNF